MDVDTSTLVIDQCPDPTTTPTDYIVDFVSLAQPDATIHTSFPITPTFFDLTGNLSVDAWPSEGWAMGDYTLTYNYGFTDET